jgi:hypothetical protein
MYREVGSGGRVFGVRGGPYAGAARSFRREDLPASVLARLEASLNQKALPHPLGKRADNRTRPLYAALFVAGVATAILLGLAFGTARGTLVHEGLLSVVYAALGALSPAGFVRLGILLRQARIPTGTFLLPLDLVTLSKSSFTVRPLGGLRKAEVGQPSSGGRASLRLTFEDGHSETFGFASMRGADAAYAELEAAQGQLEELTYAPDPEFMVLLDPLFSIRDSELWNHAKAIELEVAKPSLAERAKALSPLAVALGALSLIFGAGAGAALRSVRNGLADDHFFQVSSAQDYLEKTKMHRHDLMARGRVEAKKTEAAEQAKVKRMDAEYAVFAERDLIRTRRRGELSAALQEEETKLLTEARVGYAKVASTRDPVRTFVQAALARGSDSGKRTILVRFERRGKPSRMRTCSPEHQLLAMERQMVLSLNIVLAQKVSPLVLSFQLAKESEAEDLIIRSSISSAASPWSPMTFAVSLLPIPVGAASGSGASKPKAESFTLNMPEPKAEPKLRASSIFASLPEASCMDEGFVFYARGLDRLYDELHGFFFSGPIQVPAGLAK